MLDGFDAKRQMVKHLMDMLKHNAADEVGGYGEKKQVTLTPVPEGSVAKHPHKKESFHAGAKPAHEPKPMEGTTADEAKMPLNMAEGGLAGTDMSGSDEPNRVTEPKGQSDGSADVEALKNLPGPVEDENAEKEAAQSLHNENMMDEDEDNNSSSFEAFFPRKKKK